MVAVSRLMRWIAGSLLVVLLVIGARFVTTFPTRISVIPNLQVDASAYDTIAWSLSKTWSIVSIPPLQPPGFVAFLGVVYAIFDRSWTAGRFALWGCLVAITLISGLVARRLYRREGAGWTAALLCASSPALVAYAGTLQYELLAALMLIGLLSAAVRMGSGRQPPSLGTAAALGAGIGLAVLTREVLVVLAPIVSCYLFLRVAPSEGRRRALMVAAVCFICAVLPPLTWSAVQSARVDRPVTLSDKGPLVMAFGNNPAANGTFNTPLVGTPEPSGWAFIVSHPGATAWLWVRKAGYFWGFLRDGWNVPRPSAIVVANALAGAVPLQWILPWARGGWLLVAFLIALAWWRRETWAVWWLVPATVAAVMLVHVVTISSYRFAVPILPLVMTVIAGPVSQLLMWVWQAKTTRALAAAIVALVLGAQLVSWPLTYELAATTLDGIGAANQFDEVSVQPSRFADASRGRRPVLVLPDEYLASGSFTIHLSARTTADGGDSNSPLVRVAVTTIDGSVACDHMVSRRDVRPEPTTIALPCRLERSGSVTLLVETLGVADLLFGSVRLVWNRSRG